MDILLRAASALRRTWQSSRQELTSSCFFALLLDCRSHSATPFINANPKPVLFHTGHHWASPNRKRVRCCYVNNLADGSRCGGVLLAASHVAPRQPDRRARWLSRQSAPNEIRGSLASWRLPHVLTRPTCPGLLRTAGRPVSAAGVHRCRLAWRPVPAQLFGRLGERIVPWKPDSVSPAALVSAAGGVRNVPRALRSADGRVGRYPARRLRGGRNGGWPGAAGAVLVQAWLTLVRLVQHLESQGIAVRVIAIPSS
jgi:hypothetical protein